MKALNFLRSLGASQPSVVHPRLDRARPRVKTDVSRQLARRLSRRGRPQRAITARQVFAREVFEATAIAATVSASPGEGIHKYGF